MTCTDGADGAASHLQRGFKDLVAEQGPAALDENIGHDVALLVLRGQGDRARLIFRDKLLDRKLAEVRQRAAQRLVVPIPPGKLRKASGNGVRKASLDRPRRITRHDGVSRDVLGHDSTGRDHGAGPDAAAGQHDGAMPDPDVMADMDAVSAPPFEEFGLVAFTGEIGAGAIGEVGLRRPVHRVVARIDPRHRRDRAEFSDCGVGDLRVVHDIGIVAHLHLEQDRAGADLAIAAESRFAAASRWDRWRVQPRAFCRSS